MQISAYCRYNQTRQSRDANSSDWLPASLRCYRHYGKHHAGYVEKQNKLIPGTEFEPASLEEIITKATGGIFNNAAQIWNHTMYWNCLSTDGGGTPQGQLARIINEQFGSFARFRDRFSESAATNFGSGWTWLVKYPNDTPDIVNTGNAGNPMTERRQPLLTCDVWEHAYYIDYGNARAKYIQGYWNLVNWNFVAKHLAEPVLQQSSTKGFARKAAVR